MNHPLNEPDTLTRLLVVRGLSISRRQQDFLPPHYHWQIGAI